jgi:hypothetical protein
LQRLRYRTAVVRPRVIRFRPHLQAANPMRDSSKDAGTVQVLLNRLNNERLPIALELKKKVDRGERLTDHDMQFLSKVFTDAGDARRLAEKHPELHALVAKLTSLYSEISRKALENEQKSTGA